MTPLKQRLSGMGALERRRADHGLVTPQNGFFGSVTAACTRPRSQAAVATQDPQRTDGGPATPLEPTGG
jgi:hypothetical protein